MTRVRKSPLTAVEGKTLVQIFRVSVEKQGGNAYNLPAIWALFRTIQDQD